MENVVKINEIVFEFIDEKETSTGFIQEWKTNLQSLDGDTIMIYVRYDNILGFENISFNPFSGIPSDDLCIEYINIQDAAKTLKINVNDYEEDVLPFAIVAELLKRIFNL
jgi:hypothetical protein